VLVSEGIHRLTRGVTNFYLIEESGKFTLVDAGTPGAERSSWNALTGRVGPQIMPSGLNENTAQALASLDALRGISADLRLPGHGDPWTPGVPEALRQARAAGPS
jgi:glyoxylase-like metal-dependent hydrolase (beta-lactamase superfamily II)